MPNELVVALPHLSSGPMGATFPTYEIRAQRIALDADLARLFGVQTFRLNEQLKRNLDRFSDYAFQLTADEFAALTSQIAISKTGRGGRRTAPWAFTEHGVVMVATILNSEPAIHAMRLVVETFVAAHRMAQRLFGAATTRRLGEAGRMRGGQRGLPEFSPQRLEARPEALAGKPKALLVDATIGCEGAPVDATPTVGEGLASAQATEEVAAQSLHLSRR
jgi:hypothetical protein